MSANALLRRLLLMLFAWLIPLAVSAASFTNPLGDRFKDPKTGVQNAILAIVNFMLYISVALAVGGIIFGGLKIIWPVNKEEHMKEGKKIIAWSIGGLVFVFLAFLIVRFVGNLLGVAGA